jgi:glycosyltransferase involved in cell wall biosynthesis
MSSVTVVIPAYNAARTLGETLASVMRQTLPVAEIIVVDDGSTDGTAAVATACGGVRLLRQQNAGPGAAANAGAGAATGTVLAFLDADDLWTENAIASHMALLDGDPAIDGTAGYMEEFVCPSEPADARSRFTPRARVACWLGGGMAVRATAFRAVGPFDAGLRAGHWIDWMDRAKRAGLRFALHETLVLRRRLHRNSMSMEEETRSGRGLLQMAHKALLRRRQEAAAQAPPARQQPMTREDPQ